MKKFKIAKKRQAKFNAVKLYGEEKKEIKDFMIISKWILNFSL